MRVRSDERWVAVLADLLGLVRWHNLVLQALEERDGDGELVDGVDRAALLVRRRRLRVRTDEIVNVCGGVNTGSDSARLR